MSLAQGVGASSGYIKKEHQERRDHVAGGMFLTPRRSTIRLGRNRRPQGSGQGVVEKRKPRFRDINMAGYIRLRQICLVAPHLEPR